MLLIKDEFFVVMYNLDSVISLPSKFLCKKIFLPKENSKVAKDLALLDFPFNAVLTSSLTILEYIDVVKRAIEEVNESRDNWKIKNKILESGHHLHHKNEEFEDNCGRISKRKWKKWSKINDKSKVKWAGSVCCLGRFDLKM